MLSSNSSSRVNCEVTEAAVPERRMTVVCLGAGYVGGPTCAVMALKCPHIDVHIVDISSSRIDAWNSEHLPIYEPGLDEIVFACRGRNLFFSTDVDGAIAAADIIFISVNTPTKVAGEGAGSACDLKYIESAARCIAAASTSPKIVVEKSTVPVRTADAVRSILESNARPGASFAILSNPEFLAEGTAITDLLRPDRILIGCAESPAGHAAMAALADVYANWVPRDRIVGMNLWSSELAKVAANAMLGQRISSMNALSAICERTGANITEVARAIGLDSRIGPKYLNAGIGYGGTCLEKDIRALCWLAHSLNLPEVAHYWSQVTAINDWQKLRVARQVLRRLHGTVTGKKIAVLGFAFKKNTGDTRESAAIALCKFLADDGARLHVYDPKVSADQIHADLRHAGVRDADSSVVAASDAYAACHGAHAVVVCTEWDEFKAIDFARVHKGMLRPAYVFDGRLVLDHAALRKIGFVVDCIGRASPAPGEEAAWNAVEAAASSKAAAVISSPTKKSLVPVFARQDSGLAPATS
ncbi:hypothetical protein H9P43_006083 [Blastocladiella emersonii ATCC 22665]|nr:hypothetical protein H9P43_006083 [Blastocladiella emersonii ATCC 22665]